jgi:hypothetical protein
VLRIVRLRLLVLASIGRCERSRSRRSNTAILISSLRLLYWTASRLLSVCRLTRVLLLRWRRRRRCLLSCVSSILRRRVLIINFLVAIARRLLILAALVVRHGVLGAGVVDRVAGWLCELVDAPEHSIASRLSVGSARDPHEELAFY